MTHFRLYGDHTADEGILEFFSTFFIYALLISHLQHYHHGFRVGVGSQFRLQQSLLVKSCSLTACSLSVARTSQFTECFAFLLESTSPFFQVKKSTSVVLFHRGSNASHKAKQEYVSPNLQQQPELHAWDTVLMRLCGCMYNLF